MTVRSEPPSGMLRNRQSNTTSFNAAGQIPLRPFGKHQDVRISALGMGGHHLGDAKDEQTAVALVQEAVDGGITFFDNCWEYHRGKSEVWMGKGLQWTPRQSIPDDQGVHTWPRRFACHADAGAIANPATNRSSGFVASSRRFV